LSLFPAFPDRTRLKVFEIADQPYHEINITYFSHSFKLFITFHFVMIRGYMY
jgi:hypothetical protein